MSHEHENPRPLSHHSTPLVCAICSGRRLRWAWIGTGRVGRPKPSIFRLYLCRVCFAGGKGIDQIRDIYHSIQGSTVPGFR